jgi:hypothetical protein
MTAAALRQRQRRQRQAAGRRCLLIEVDVVDLTEALISAGMLDAGWDDDWPGLEAAVERLIATICHG